MTSGSPGMGAALFPPRSPPGLLPLEGAPNVMNFFRYGAVLGLVLDKVRVMQIGRFKKFLEVVFGRPSLPLEFAFGSRYEPLAGVVGFHTIVAVVGHYGDAMGSTLLTLLASLSTFPGAFDGGLGRHGSATSSDHFRVTIDKGSSNRLFARGYWGS
jgi:hypothetical protein